MKLAKKEIVKQAITKWVEEHNTPFRQIDIVRHTSLTPTQVKGAFQSMVKLGELYKAEKLYHYKIGRMS